MKGAKTFAGIVALFLVITPELALLPGLVAPTAAEQQGENVELVSQAGGPTYAVFVQGNYAYIGAGPRLLILDISNVKSPRVIGQTGPLQGLVKGIAVTGNYAYIAAEEKGLRIVDVSNAASPKEVAYFDTATEARDVAISGNNAYVACAKGLCIIDVSTPTAPKQVGVLDTPGTWDVAVSGSYAYVAAAEKGLRIIDTSAPASPREVGSIDTPGKALGIAISGNYAYIANEARGLRVVDISTPSSPKDTGHLDTAGEGVWASPFPATMPTSLLAPRAYIS